MFPGPSSPYKALKGRPYKALKGLISLPGPSSPSPGLPLDPLELPQASLIKHPAVVARLDAIRISGWIREKSLKAFLALFGLRVLILEGFRVYDPSRPGGVQREFDGLVK